MTRLNPPPHVCPTCMFLGVETRGGEEFDHFVCHATPDDPLLVRFSHPSGTIDTLPLRHWLTHMKGETASTRRGTPGRRFWWTIRFLEQWSGVRFSGLRNFTR